MSKKLTKRQAGVFLYIYDYIEENHYPPTVREIADYFDIKSTNGVVEHLRALERKGLIKKDASRSRSLLPLVSRDEVLHLMGNDNNQEETVLRRPIVKSSPVPSRHILHITDSKPTLNAPKKTIPVIGNIAAGSPIFAEENFEEALEIDPSLFCRGSDNLYALRVRGTSMIGDGIMPGDIVIVRPQQTAEEGEIIAAMLDGSATVKRYEKRKDGIYLIPSNPAMDPIVVRPEEQIDFKILGSIRGVIRMYR